MLTRRNIFQSSLAGMLGFFSSKVVLAEDPILVRRKLFTRGLLRSEGTYFLYNGKGGFKFSDKVSRGDEIVVPLSSGFDLFHKVAIDISPGQWYALWDITTLPQGWEDPTSLQIVSDELVLSVNRT